MPQSANCTCLRCRAPIQLIKSTDCPGLTDCCRAEKWLRNGKGGKKKTDQSQKILYCIITGRAELFAYSSALVLRSHTSRLVV